MTAPDDTNSAPAIRRVRRRGDAFHVTLTNGRRINVAQAVNGRYQSSYSYGATNAAVNVKPVSGR